MELVETVIEDARWESFRLEALAERAGQAVLAGLGLPVEGFAISLMGCDDARIATLNADFRGKPQPTNVRRSSRVRRRNCRSRARRTIPNPWATSRLPGTPAPARQRRRASRWRTM
jgi:probable rRNA maturation factor